VNRLPEALLRAVAAGDTILAPNSEIAFALRAAVNLHRESLGDRVWQTPRIVPLDAWALAEIHDELRQGRDHPRVLSKIEHAELWRLAIAADSHSHGLMQPRAAAASAAHALRAMRDYGIDCSVLRQFDSEEARALARWSDTFREMCRARAAITELEILPRLTPAAGLRWIASLQWPPYVRSWLDAHAGEAIPPARLPAPAPVEVRAVAAAADELEAMAAWAALKLRENPRARLWCYVADLGARRAAVSAAFDAALAPERLTLGIPDAAPLYAIAGGTPLAEYPVVAVVLELLTASRGGVRFEKFSSLLRSPYLAMEPRESIEAAALDADLRTRAPAEATLRDWLRLAGGEAGVIVRLGSALTILEEIKSHAAPSRWSALFTRAMHAAPWCKRTSFSSVEYQAATRCGEILAAFAAIDRSFTAITGQEAIRMFRSALAGTQFQVQTGVPPVWITGSAEDPWALYDGLWLANLRERLWPPPADPVPLLPLTLQHRFGIPQASADAQGRMAAELFAAWQIRAPICIASYAQYDGDREVRPSPLLNVPVGENEAPIQSTPALPRLWQEQWQQRQTLQQRDDFGPAYLHTQMRRGVMPLRWQSACPFQGFAKTRLQAESLRLPAPGLDDLERGLLAHRVLEETWRRIGSHAALLLLDEPQRLQLAREAVNAALAAAVLRREPYFDWREHERERLVAMLRGWLEVELVRAPFAVTHLEQRELSAEHGGLNFSIRIDRVDTLADGSHVIIDYKTSGSVNADWRNDRPENPQLPVYGLLYRESLAAIAYAKLSWPDQKFVIETPRSGVFKEKSRPSTLEDQPNFDALMVLWDTRLAALAQELRSGYAAVIPRAGACERCDLSGLCRIHDAVLHD
jgi:ATP-dependent helicase/nuclease subunit B